MNNANKLILMGAMLLVVGVVDAHAQVIPNAPAGYPFAPPGQQLPPPADLNRANPAPQPPREGDSTAAPFDSKAYMREMIANPPPQSAVDAMPSHESNGVDPMLARGQAAFERGCVGCHDADRSFNKIKSLKGWQATVRRMATKDGAEVPADEVEPISVYLAMQSGTLAQGEVVSGGVPPSGVTIFGSLSPTWRGGDAALQNPGFFPDVWFGANIETGSPLSGRVTACITCHSDGGVNDRIALVDAVVRLDVVASLGCPWSNVKSAVEAGRFIVPFGAFSAQSNPGVYRTVTKPLIYNMGMRIYDGVIGQSVLPLPFSDEGANISLGAKLWGDTYLNWNNYVINGLQATRDGINFDMSRDYVGFNNSPTAGTRLTMGNEWLTLGSSLMTGQSSATGGVAPNNTALYYRIYGFDATYRFKDYVRLQFEYARRDSDRVVDIPLPFRTTDQVQGYYGEAEFRLYKDVRALHFLMRYDLQQQVSITDPQESNLGRNSFFVSRFTYGFNFTLANSSTIILNHEHWMMPNGLAPVNVFGTRWSYSF